MLAQKEITEVHFWTAWGVADIQEIYLWDVKVRPTKKYVLYDETYFQNSTSWSSWTISTKNWKLARTSYSFGGGNWNFSYTTMDWYPCAKVQPSHWNHHVWILDAAYNDVYANYKFLKIVCDYIRIDTSSASYWWWVESWTWENLWYLNWWNNWANWTSLNVTSWAKYIFEQEIDLTNNSSIVTLTDIDTWVAQTTPEYTKQWSRETSSTYIIQNWYKVLWIVSDQSNTIYEWNIHLYVSN